MCNVCALYFILNIYLVRSVFDVQCSWLHNLNQNNLRIMVDKTKPTEKITFSQCLFFPLSAICIVRTATERKTYYSKIN